VDYLEFHDCFFVLQVIDYFHLDLDRHFHHRLHYYLGLLRLEARLGLDLVCQIIYFQNLIHYQQTKALAVSLPLTGFTHQQALNLNDRGSIILELLVLVGLLGV
jgi:hypothetical protein